MQPHEQLEQEWAKFNDLDPRGMVACSSGTAALHLALEALELPRDSEVIVPDFTMIACPRAVTLAGLTPVFVDCDERLCIDPKLVAKAQSGLVGPWTDEDGEDHVYHGIMAIMPVHVYGRRCDMNELHKVADTFDAFVVEDLAEAHGVRPHPSTDAACWSFYKNKIVAGEEGGAVWFRDNDAAKIARELRSLGFSAAHDFMHRPRGHNYRMSDLHAEYILAPIGASEHDFYNKNGLYWYESVVSIRREIENWYDGVCPAEWRMPPRDAPWVYDVRIPGLGWSMLPDPGECIFDAEPPYNRRPDYDSALSTVVGELNRAGIAARHGFKPMHEQLEYTSCRAVGPERKWQCCLAAREVFYLPIAPGVTTRDDCRRAFEIVKSILS